MIHANRIVTVGEQECIIDRPIVLYRGDREVEIEFTLVGNEFMFSEEGNVIKSVNASHGQLVLNTPSGEHMFSELAECHEGKVVFVVTKEMIDEFIEMGFYSFQIRLYDSAEMKSRVTIPPVMNGFDIRNPIAAEDETNVVDQGIVDYARIFKDQSNEELPTFTWDGEYVKTEWAHHDVITENKMNKIEDALYSINANIKESDVVMLNALDTVKKDADKYVKEHMAEVEADVDEFERNLNTGVEKFKVDANAAMTAHKNEVSEVVDGFSGEIESINTQLAHNEYNIDVLKSDKYILDISKSDFDTEFLKAIDLAKKTKKQIFIPQGDYISYRTFKIDYEANIVFDKGCLIDINTTFLDICSPNCNIINNGVINVLKDCDVITLNPASHLPIDVLTDCNLNFNIYSSNNNNNITGLKINAPLWKNNININTDNLKIGLNLSCSWANSNFFTGKLTGFEKAIFLNIKSRSQSNLYKMEIQHHLNKIGYGVFLSDECKLIDANVFNINHWIDNYNGKYYCYYSSNNKYFKNNRIEGQLEGLLSIDLDANIMNSLFYTNRDRSVVINDYAGTHNAPLLTNTNANNEIKLNNFELFDKPQDMQIYPINNVKLSFIYDNELKTNVLCVNQTDTGMYGGYAAYTIFDNRFSGKTITFTCKVKIGENNINEDYYIYLNDGFKGVGSVEWTSKKTSGWVKMSVTMDVDESATLLQLNFGRSNISTNNRNGDVIYFSEPMIVIGSSNNNHYSKSITETNLVCDTLPNPTVKHRGMLLIHTYNGVDKVYICVQESSNNYVWKELSLI